MPSACSLETLQAIRLKAVEALPDAMLVVNHNRIVVDMNEEAELIFGRARGEIIGQPIEVLMPEEYRENHVQHIARFFQSPRRREMGEGRKLEALNRDNRFPVQIKLAPIIVEGSDGGVFGLAIVRRLTT